MERMARGTPFSFLIATFDRLETTAASLQMIDILSRLLQKLPPTEGRMAAYLLKGKVAADFEGMELGMAAKFVGRAIALATGATQKRVVSAYRVSGDLGNAAAFLLARERSIGITLPDIFRTLQAIARASGNGSQERKISLLTGLLKRCSKREARYVVRAVLGTLRLRVAEMTFLNALSLAVTGSRAHKATLERAFNVLSDLGEVAERVLRGGLKAVARVKPVVGKPVRMMLAQRVKDLTDVHRHIGGAVIVEYKYDGERIQAHIRSKRQVTLYSRRMEDITHQYPDVIKGLQRGFRGQEAIVEGEVVAIDHRSGKLQPFQTLMQRRRKHDINRYVKGVPVRYFLFDMLYVNRRSLLVEPLAARKELLQKSLGSPAAGRRTRAAFNGTLALATHIRSDDPGEIEGFFANALESGAEGVMIKSPSSPYQAGKRGWHWIKYKRDYREGLADAFDLVVVGALHGRGQRAKTFGSLLVAAFNPRANRYESFTKVGTGFSDAALSALPKLLKPYRRADKHRLVDTLMQADVWFDPALVMEVTGADITVSPVHTVAKDRLKKGGLALRFPRFLKWRDDKAPEQATTVQEIEELYRRMQGSRAGQRGR